MHISRSTQWVINCTIYPPTDCVCETMINLAHGNQYGGGGRGCPGQRRSGQSPYNVLISLPTRAHRRGQLQALPVGVHKPPRARRNKITKANKAAAAAAAQVLERASCLVCCSRAETAAPRPYILFRTQMFVHNTAHLWRMADAGRLQGACGDNITYICECVRRRSRGTHLFLSYYGFNNSLLYFFILPSRFAREAAPAIIPWGHVWSAEYDDDDDGDRELSRMVFCCVQEQYDVLCCGNPYGSDFKVGPTNCSPSYPVPLAILVPDRRNRVLLNVNAPPF